MGWKGRNYQKKRILWGKREGWRKAEKGQFVVYSRDKKRFVLPLGYLNNNIFRELFKLAEEEFGLSSNLPLTLPCEATLIDYVITLIQRNVTKDLEEPLLTFLPTTTPCQSYFDFHLHLHRQPTTTNQHLLCSY
ncbi:hypothetical protein VNO78_05133 [Psophocarpus tetragonolobus]|uniref:Small auxin up regulated protein n=1 Tax=Psophocarpus tetragonolobus TaxID=3891 RepID=A0AAN9XR94_PSOTE